MKISPVQGTPTIPNPASTGLAPEKLQRLKAIAAGQEPEKSEAEAENKDQILASTQPSITMKTNRNPETPASAAPAPEIAGNEPDSGISDDSAQTNAPVEATQPLSPQLAAIAKGRRALQQERLAFEKDKADIEARFRAEVEAKLKSNALGYMQEHGVSYDQLTNEILAAQSGTNPEILSLKAEIKALREGVDKTLSDKDAAQEKAVLTEIRRTVNQMAQLKPYALISKTKSEGDVVDLIHRTYKKTGEVLDEGEAMNLVKEQILEEMRALAEVEEVRGLLTPPQAPLQPQPTQGIKTLTNKDSARPATTRRQRAIAKMLGQT